MASRIRDLPFAFKELQKAFNLSPVIEIHSSLHNQLKLKFNLLNSSFPLAPPTSPSVPDLSTPHFPASTTKFSNVTLNNSKSKKNSKTANQQNLQLP